MSKHNNKWIHGLTKIVLPPLPPDFMRNAGIFYLSLILDKEVGEEEVLIIFDPTEFIYKLRDVVPFNFYMSSVELNTSYGPVYSFLFWVTDPKDNHEAFAVFDKPIDISKPQLIRPWLKLANQTHIHLLLLDKNYETAGFYEFDNTFGFSDAIEIISKIKPDRVLDFVKAVNEYFNMFSLEELFEMVKES